MLSTGTLVMALSPIRRSGRDRPVGSGPIILIVGSLGPPLRCGPVASALGWPAFLTHLLRPIKLQGLQPRHRRRGAPMTEVTLDTSDVDRWIGVPLGGGELRDPVVPNDIRRWSQGMHNANPL